MEQLVGIQEEGVFPSGFQLSPLLPPPEGLFHFPKSLFMGIAALGAHGALPTSSKDSEHFPTPSRGAGTRMKAERTDSPTTALPGRISINPDCLHPRKQQKSTAKARTLCVCVCISLGCASVPRVGLTHSAGPNKGF